LIFVFKQEKGPLIYGTGNNYFFLPWKVLGIRNFTLIFTLQKRTYFRAPGKCLKKTKTLGDRFMAMTFWVHFVTRLSLAFTVYSTVNIIGKSLPIKDYFFSSWTLLSKNPSIYALLLNALSGILLWNQISRFYKTIANYKGVHPESSYWLIIFVNLQKEYF
jgi:hypothetical protein